MAYVITDACIKDSLCVDVCPTDCIHPKQDEAGFEAAAQLYVDPVGCIDCGACIPECPVNAIYLDTEVPAQWTECIQLNADRVKVLKSAGAHVTEKRLPS